MGSCHFNLPPICPNDAEVDELQYGLITDLKQRGLLDDTIVVWGEFGRSTYSQNGKVMESYRHDIIPVVLPNFWQVVVLSQVYSLETDDFSYRLTKDEVSVHDLRYP